MHVSDLSSIGSLVSGMAVLVSLVYLSLQLRQTVRNQRALMNQGIITLSAENLRSNVKSAISALFARVQSGEKDFSAHELVQLELHLRTVLVSVQDTYVQHRAGLADQVTFDNALAAVRLLMRQAVYRALWKRGRTNYASEWMSFVDKVIAETPLAKPVDLVAQFKVDLAEVLH